MTVTKALTNPEERLKYWWRGKLLMRGIGMGGKPLAVAGEYREIERPRVLAFTWLPDWQADATVTLVRWVLEERRTASPRFA